MQTPSYIPNTFSAILLADYFRAYGQPLNSASKDSYTFPLHFAAHNGNLALISFLVEKGLLVNTQDECGVSALLLACMQGQEEAVALLVSLGANVKLADRYGMTPLERAATLQALNQVRLFASAYSAAELMIFLRLPRAFPLHSRVRFFITSIIQTEKLPDLWDWVVRHEKNLVPLMRRARLGLFQAYKDPIQQTGLALDIQLKIAREHLMHDESRILPFVAVAESLLGAPRNDAPT